MTGEHIVAEPVAPHQPGHASPAWRHTLLVQLVRHTGLPYVSCESAKVERPGVSSTRSSRCRLAAGRLFQAKKPFGQAFKATPTPGRSGLISQTRPGARMGEIGSRDRDPGQV